MTTEKPTLELPRASPFTLVLMRISVLPLPRLLDEGQRYYSDLQALREGFIDVGDRTDDPAHILSWMLAAVIMGIVLWVLTFVWLIRYRDQLQTWTFVLALVLLFLVPGGVPLIWLMIFVLYPLPRPEEGTPSRRTASRRKSRTYPVQSVQRMNEQWD
jgi:hypothetical protein